jgi:histidinol phosphatase-like enzyme
MKNIVIFDLDGTIALIDKRRNLSLKDNSKIDWNIFFNPKNIKLDQPNFPVIEILNSLKEKGFKIFILSGRLDTTKDATLKWLKENAVEFDQLKMRENTPKEKYISDVELKQKWLNEIDKENILCVFDDRTKLVEMWRENGLSCFQVADGNF